MLHEWNFDGLVGPTHNYGGLSAGNVASMTHGGQVSNPRAAALQGLSKMRFVRSLGVRQAVLPPQPRPDVATLRRLGFRGSDEAVLSTAWREHEQIVRLCASASSMWTANAATVAPSTDTEDGRLHLTPANLSAMFHRAIEAQTTTRVLRRIFSAPDRFQVHDPLPAHFADEGAANHTRLDGVHLFAWGRRAFVTDADAPKRFPARQTLEASEAIARLHRLSPARTVFARQHREGIDAGAFHTDVLAVGSGRFLMLHELAFADRAGLERELRKRLGDGLVLALATNDALPVADAVKAYPFNSQVVELPDGSMAVVAPTESRENERARAFLESLPAPISKIHYLDVRESMDNGGGPACLRLRVPMTDEESAVLGARVALDDALATSLEDWVRRHYRDRLVASDLGDPALWREQQTALDELTRLLDLGSVYDFQRA